MGRRVGVVGAIVIVLALAGCGWTFPGYDAAATRYNGAESTVSAANVAGLKEQWRAPGPSGEVLVDKGRLYTTITAPSDLSTDETLGAYDLGGNTGCSGAPRTCAPLFRFGNPGCAGCLTRGFGIADDTVFRWVGDASTPFGIAAFDATGAKGCDQQTHVCQPLRTYPIPQVQSFVSGVGTPVVVDGVLYVVTSNADNTTGALLAFDARGAQSCTTVTVVCSPLRTTLLPAFAWSTPAIADGVAYVTNYTGVAAIDLHGTSNCSGAPLVCTPMWVTSGTTPTFALSDPAVARGHVYVVDPGGLRVYDAHGVTGCANHVCAPLWTAASTSTIVANPLVMGTRVFIARTDRALSAYDADGVSGCHGTPKTCDPLSSATAFENLLRTTGANGLVVTTEYQDVGHGVVQVYGPDLGSTPLWEEHDTNFNTALSVALIADGKLIVAVRNNLNIDPTLVVYALP